MLGVFAKARRVFGGINLSCFPFLHASNKRSVLSNHKFHIIFLWCFGLLTGCYFGFKTPDFVISLMRTSVSERVSIVWQFVALLIPLILAVTALRLSQPLLLLPVVFLKAHSFGYCLYCVTYAFGSAGWLVSLFCFFSDLCSISIFLTFVLSHAAWERGKSLHDCVICALALIALGLFDYFMVSPFWVGLLNY